ncbi:P450 cytochrome [Flammeovirgaceae bacterium 311]|nr:P450 cytochrome [Flammeovirgaceae bacterium 311]
MAIARNGWILLTGGRDAGVMEAASRGAKSAGGLTIGILPGESVEGAASAIDIPIITGMGSARNWINILSSRVIVVCGMGAGTASEAALALKASKPLVLFRQSPETVFFYNKLAASGLMEANTVAQVVKSIEQLLQAEKEKGR